MIQSTTLKQSKVQYKYCIVVHSSKKDMAVVGKAINLKLDCDGYPVVDKVYSILSS